MGKGGGRGGATLLPGVDVVTLEVGVVGSPDVARGNASDIIGGGRGDRKLVWNPVSRCVVCEEESTFTGFLAFSSAFSFWGSFTLSVSVHSSSEYSPGFVVVNTSPSWFSSSLANEVMGRLCVCCQQYRLLA